MKKTTTKALVNLMDSIRNGMKYLMGQTSVAMKNYVPLTCVGLYISKAAQQLA